MPYETVRVPTPTPTSTHLIPGHVSPACDTHTLDGPSVAPSSPLGSTVDRVASFVAVSPMARLSLLLADPVNGRTGAAPGLGDDADYIREVLVRSDVATEAEIEQELVAKAAALRIELPTSGRPYTQEQTTAVARSRNATAAQHSRAVSAGSDGTANSRMTLQTSDHAAAALATSIDASLRRRSKSLNYSHYERYISQVDPALDQPKFRAGGIVVKSGSKKGVRGFTRSIAARLKRRRPNPNLPMPCVCCREDFTADNNTLHTLPCGHCYCRDCLAVMIDQSMADESKMPPRCCTQPIPSAIIKLVLSREKQHLFLKAVVEYSTPWEARIFCPNAACGEFIPPADKVDPKAPFEALCKTCRARACVMCRRHAHPLGQDCPEDRDSDAVLKMGEKSGWRRCYKCRSLVELAHGCTHITCRCKAQFCYICGAVWDPAVGCPNFCNGEEELERRRAEEEARLAELEAEKLAREQAAEAEKKENQDAERRTQESRECSALREQQAAEMARFLAYERRARDAMLERQSRRKLALVDKFSDLMDKMRERHAKTEQHLEDRQVMAELELQAGLQEKEKKVRIKLRYMEDYCSGKTAGELAGEPQQQQRQHDEQEQQNEQNEQEQEATAAADSMPQRRVTERDLEQLRQQYCVRDGMERRHQSQINGLREKQAKSMEELVARHERETDALADRRAEEVEDLAVAFANEEEGLLRTSRERRARLVKRWGLAARILRVELERREKKSFAAVELPEWPPEAGEDDDGLVVIGGGGGGGGGGGV